MDEQIPKAVPKPLSCQACGAALPLDAPMGLCVPCLFGSCLSDQRSAHFGDFELLGPGKEGGMGVVYRARQMSLDRLVAVKMIRGAFLNTDAQVQRFRAEAEAAASLDHPHIVPIYDIGEHEGRHHFTMKWIEGGSLADTLADKTGMHRASLSASEEKNASRGEKKQPRTLPPFPLRHSAELLATVARAVHHAHQRGIIHRDLKPSNILLDTYGSPLVTDFGLAKRFETPTTSSPEGSDHNERARFSNPRQPASPPQLTLSGETLGTPAYMAPEQAANPRDASTAADVYSLGAILYELLTGQPPFVAETPLATMRQVLEEEPRKPSAISSPLSCDLETICLKCLEKNPARRYSSAAALADDLEHWLRGEPIQARPGGICSRAAKWIRRRPAVATLTVGLALAILLGFAGVLWQLGKARRASRQALENLKTAFGAVQQLTALVADERLQEPGIDDLHQKLMETAITALDSFVAQRGGDPEFEVQRGNAYRVRAQLMQARGDFAEAESAYRAAITQQQTLLRRWPAQAAYRRDLASTYAGLGWLLTEGSRHEEGVAMLTAALAALEGVHDPEAEARVYHELARCFVRHPTRGMEAERPFRESLIRWQQLATAGKTHAEFRFQLGLTKLNLGSHLSNQGRLDETEALWNDALVLFRALADSDPGSPEYLHKLSLTLDRLGRLYADSGRWEKADPSFNEALGILANLARNFPRRLLYQRSLADQHYQLGFRYSDNGQTNAAEAAFKQAVASQTALASAHPETDGYFALLSTYQLALANFHQKNGQELLAELLSREAIGSASHAVGLRPKDSGYAEKLALAHSKLAFCLPSDLAHRSAIETNLLAAITIRERLLSGPASSTIALRKWLALDLSALATLYRQSKRFEEAFASTQKARLIDPSAPPTAASALTETKASAQWYLAQDLKEFGREAEALQEFRTLEPMLVKLSDAAPSNFSYRARLERTRREIQRIDRQAAKK